MDCTKACAHPFEPHEACSARTKSRKPCKIHADRMRDGKWICHVHDPLGAYQRARSAPRVPIH